MAGFTPLDAPAASAPVDPGADATASATRVDGVAASAATVAVMALLGALLWSGLPQQGTVIIVCLAILIAATIWLLVRLNADWLRSG